MTGFHYLRPASLDEATAALVAQDAAPLGGGTDLLVTIRERIAAPSELVDLRRIPGARDITVRADGSVRIGATARLAEIAAHPVIAEQFAALAQAATSVGTPQLRNMGTIGGNLGQRIRCWYFRRNLPCWKHGGAECLAWKGENQYHAIFGRGPCHAVHPSDPAVALTALDATVEIAGAHGASRTISMSQLYAGAHENREQETTLAHGEVIAAVELPAASAGGTQYYEKLMQRGAWDFALVSLAAHKRTDGNVRLVLGGVAAGPYEVNSSIAEDVASGGLDGDSIDALAERAMYDAEPLSNNGYKVWQAQALLRRAMQSFGA